MPRQMSGIVPKFTNILIHTLSNSLFTDNPAVGCYVVYAAAIIKM